MKTKFDFTQWSCGVFALFCMQIFSTLSFSVLYSTLVLYLTSSLRLTTQAANTIMGVFVALNFTLHLLGGYLGGRFISNRSLFSIGMLAQIIGCLLLATVNASLLYVGLAAFLTGCGLNVTCLNCMLTQRFLHDNQRRETAFLYNYAGMNIGFFIGFSLSGYFQLTENYQKLFLLSSLGNVVALLICLFSWHQLADHNTIFAEKNSRNKLFLSMFAIFLVLILFLILNPLLSYASFASQLVQITSIGMLAGLLLMNKFQEQEEIKNKIYAFVVLLLVSTIFWTLYQIGPMGLTYFINHNVKRQWAQLIIPPQWFQNINTFSIVLGGPLLSFVLSHLRRRGLNIHIPLQFSCALLLIGLSFVILPLGIYMADQDGLVNASWIVWSFILQSLGELLISPIGYAMIGNLAPPSWQGIMMGMWMMTSGVGATLASYSSNWMTAGVNSTDPILTNPGYGQVFLILGLSALIASVILFAISPLLKPWMNNTHRKKLKQANLAVVIE